MLLNEVLDLSKIEAGKMTVEKVPIELAELIDDVISLMAVKAQHKQLQLIAKIAPNVPARIHSDAMRLKQVLVNLLGNAIKFTELGSVTLSVERMPAPHNKQLRFSVTDTGIGMTREQSSTLFRAFHQADGTVTRRFGGTGLGLKICKSLVELLVEYRSVERT